MFKRAMVREDGMAREARSGDAVGANYNVTTDTTDAATTIAVDAILSGLLIRNGMTANRIDTTPTAVALADALVGMDVGDTYSFKVANFDAAQTITLAGGTDVTASGNLVVAAGGVREFVLELTDATDGAETFNLYGL